MHVWTRASKQCEFCFYLLDNFIREKCACGWYSFENIANYCSGKLHCILDKSRFRQLCCKLMFKATFCKLSILKNLFNLLFWATFGHLKLIIISDNFFWQILHIVVMENFYFANYTNCCSEQLVCESQFQAKLFASCCSWQVLANFRSGQFFGTLNKLTFQTTRSIKLANCSSGQLFLQIIQIFVLDDFICKFWKLS